MSIIYMSVLYIMSDIGILCRRRLPKYIKIFVENIFMSNYNTRFV